MSAPPPTRGRVRVLIPLLLLLILVVLGHFLFGLPDFLTYGLAGGLIFCLLIIGRDRLLAAQRQLDQQQEADATEAGGHDDHEEQHSKPAP